MLNLDIEKELSELYDAMDWKNRVDHPTLDEFARLVICVNEIWSRIKGMV